MVHVITNVLERLSDCHKSRGARLSVSVYWQNARKVQRTKNNERIIRRRAHSRIPLRCTPCDTRIHDAPLTFDLFRSVSLFLNVDRPAFHLPTLGWRVETRGCFFISRVESRLSTLRVSPPDPRPEGRGPRRFFDFSGRELTFFRNSLQGEGGSGVGEGDAVWQRAGVLGHVSDSTPLVIPFRSAGARELTPGPKPS